MLRGLLLGTDAPTLTAHRLREAADLLVAGADTVFGPALDGGYYLVGRARPLPELFAIDPASWGLARGGAGRRCPRAVPPRRGTPRRPGGVSRSHSAGSCPTLSPRVARRASRVACRVSRVARRVSVGGQDLRARRDVRGPGEDWC